ncbi:MAG TPA: radical SAM family heme chaperone HemW, partial [Thermodesulfovibrionales bacterium]|nr:radical SAM family heme chaperone HemW [Thermodesulfovibrionales bacterium]
LLPDQCFTKLFQCLRKNFLFSPDAEITIEANPGTLDESKVNTILSIGVNRLSVGIQSFHDSELRLLGRIHNSDEGFRAVETIRNAGLENYSLDLMYGLPGQTPESWTDTLRKAVELSPSHISTYELTPEKNTPLYELLQTHPFDEDIVLEMYDSAIDILSASGYGHYEISNFALPSYRCIHNLNYWDRGEYAGVGAGSHSFVRGYRARNIADVGKYIDTLNIGIIPEEESMEVTPAESLKELLFLGLRKTEGLNIESLDLAEFRSSGNKIDLFAASEDLIAEGYMELNGDYLRLTRKGIVVSNTIIVKLFENLGL